MIRLALLPLFVGICFCRVGKDKSVREAERRDTDEKTGRLPQIEEKHNTKRRISHKKYGMYVNFAACQRSDDLLYEEIHKGPLRHGAALVLALLLCTTAALAAEPVQRSLIPVGHTVGVKLFARGVVVVKLPEGGTPARTCGLKTGDVIVECGGEAVTSTEQFQSLLQKNGTDATALEIKRQGSPLTLSVEPERNEQGICCIGAWIRDSMAGIGTVTYYDPATGDFGALGHGITDGDTLEQMKQYFKKHQHAREIGDKKTMEKIEYHLTDINFHYECGLLISGQYDKLPEVIKNW